MCVVAHCNGLFSVQKNQPERSRRTFWWDWMVPHESRERFGEGVPAQIAGTYRFPGNSRGIPREYATKVRNKSIDKGSIAKGIPNIPVQQY